MNLFLHTFLLNSQANGNSIYTYINVILAIGFFMLFKIYLPTYKSKKNRFDFTNEFLRLTAFILKSDQKITTKELHFVYAFFSTEFGSDSLPFYKKKLTTFIKSKGSIKQALKKIDYEQDPTTKLQLLNFLIKITIIDGFLTKNELDNLRIITRGIGLRTYQLESILAMYSFITEKEFKQKTKYKRNSHSVIDEAYKILELSKGATSTEIKKAYRKLVILYHPDKAMHLEKEYQKSAKEMYQKVNNAYDILKESLGFK